MTGLPLRFIQNVAAGIPNSEIVRGMLIFRPTRHIVRGFMLERTSRHSEFYLWSLVTPLFTPFPGSLSLNYSKRISITDVPADPIIIDGDLGKKEKLIQVMLLEREIPWWTQLESPAGFVSEFVPRGDLSRPNVALELAIAEALANDTEAAVKRLTDVLNWKSNTPILPQVKSAGKNISRALDEGAGSFNALISIFESRNEDMNFKGITRA